MTNAEMTNAEPSPTADDLARYVIQRPNGCWIWTGPVHAKGQPIVYAGRRNGNAVYVMARRAALYLWRPGLRATPRAFAVAMCGEPLCVCPDHLTWARGSHVASR